MGDLDALVDAVAVNPLVGHPADFHVFHKFITRCKNLPAINVSVVWPLSDVAMMGAVEAASQGLIKPILVGPSAEMKALAKKLGVRISGFKIQEADTESKAAAAGVALCRSGEAQAIGEREPPTELMRAALNKELGLRTARRVSHVFIIDSAATPARCSSLTPPSISSPNSKTRSTLCRMPSTWLMRWGFPAQGCATSAVETVNTKIKSTLDAAALCKMADRGQITGGILDGPLAFDTAVSVKAAKIKGLVSPVTGQADILVVPDLESGNMLAKQLEYLGGAQLAGIVLGARVPAILTARADSADTRLTSCAVAVLLHYATQPEVKV